ncbi:MAG: hypothetical protein HY812_01290 [Planctomycetes bacterium]|nr:hypothetical protein [Planctomycetota bacterium]
MRISALRDLYRLGGSLVRGDLLRLYLRGRHRPLPDVRHQLEAAIAWLCRAQDAAGNGGVSRSYLLAYNRRFRLRGWQTAYPETTGYIIPTMFDYARFSGRQEIVDRAVRMADWECDVQMPSGAVQGGTIDREPSPAIFNTGQVIFGWLRAWKETGNTRYLASAVRAGDFLVREQDPDGAWRRNLSRFASPAMPSYTYNTRTAWALLLLATESGNTAYRDAALRNLEHALTEQEANGYFRNNCLDDSNQALLHTIAYCLRGILEAGVALGERRYLNAVTLAVRPLLAAMRGDGSLPGRFDPSWTPTVSWSCLTGQSQLALVLGRLGQTLAEPSCLEAMRRINAFQRSTQILDPRRPDLHGGLCGSHPIHGGYAPFEITSWGVKFFVDALFVEMETSEGRKLLLDPCGATAPGPDRSAAAAAPLESESSRRDGRGAAPAMGHGT